jgi:hypothetical protein
MPSASKKPHAVFDYSKVNFEWQQEFDRQVKNVTSAALTLQRSIRKQKKDEEDEDYEDYVQAFYDGKESAVETIGAASELQAKFVVQVLSDVPREWLLSNAPEEIDWSKVESLNYIQLDYYTQILSQIQTGEARKLAKN